MSNALSPVTFHGDTIFCTTYQNQPYTAMKPIIENMGLDWGSQFRKLSGCKERWSIVIMTMVASDDKERDVLCMPVRKLPAFLNTINPKKVRPELRERIELYQAESDDVLWEYWTNQQALRSAPSSELSVEDRRPLSVLIGQWAGKAHLSFPDCWRELHTVFGITTVAELPASQLPAALAWVQAKIDALEARRTPELPEPEPAPAFPVELANYGQKNFWKDLEDIVKRISAIGTAISINAPTGCLLRHEFYAATVNKQVSMAQGALMLARAALGDALRLRHSFNVWK